MALRHDQVFRLTPAYEARIAEEETKLRWLLARHRGNRDLAYYLIFLLAATGRYANALVECRRILERHPGDMVAEMWRGLILIRWHRSPPRSALRRSRRSNHRSRLLRRDYC
jgi:hypothetical protein